MQMNEEKKEIVYRSPQEIVDAARREQGLTLEQLSAITRDKKISREGGLSKSAISQILNGGIEFREKHVGIFSVSLGIDYDMLMAALKGGAKDETIARDLGMLFKEANGQPFHVAYPPNMPKDGLEAGIFVAKFIKGMKEQGLHPA